MNWIKCSDRLPKEKDWVLVYNQENHFIGCGKYMGLYDGEHKWNKDSCCCEDISPITHWAKLPKGPE